MGFMDKLKNIFFEEEEDEEIVEEPVKEKQEKEVVIKKVEIPKRNRVEEYKVPEEEQEEIKPQKEKVSKNIEIKKENKTQDLIFDDEDFILEQPKQVPKETTYTKQETYKTRENKEVVKTESYYKKETPKYEYTKKEETKKVFTPSPIISPIYGILDKNYRKEEVKEKKEIRLSTRPTKMDFDSVRNKAFGDLENDLFPSTPVSEEKKKEKEEVRPRNINRLYDMTNKDEKPSIEKVTLGEADEYFRDLGLAYNTDYKDISKDISDGKIPDDSKKKEKKEETLEDNLFDLIESMYDKED